MADNTCGCETFRNVRIPEHRNHPCARVIEKKHVLCRPCAMNWHDGPCDAYVREPVFHLVKTCARCGHDSALHLSPDARQAERDKINAIFGLS